DVLGEMGRQNLIGILILAGINLSFGFIQPGIDNFAHIGGLVTGALIGLAFVPTYRLVFDPAQFTSRLMDTNSIVKRWWVIPVTLVLLAVGTWYGNTTVPDNPRSHLREAEELIEDGDFSAALEEIQKAIDLDSLDARAYYLRAKALVETGNISTARGELLRAIAFARRTNDTDTLEKSRALLDLIGLR
ncbi:MAG: rhomboid family intramembrane serine protease, partial [Ardenticatenaceae bacterium]